MHHAQALRVAIAELKSLKAGRQVYQQKCAPLFFLFGARSRVHGEVSREMDFESGILMLCLGAFMQSLTNSLFCSFFQVRRALLS